MKINVSLFIQTPPSVITQKVTENQTNSIQESTATSVLLKIAYFLSNIKQKKQMEI